MSTTNRGRTTTSIEGIPNFDAVSDPTPGLALVYSRLHANLPAALPLAATVISIGRESDNTLSVGEAAVSRYHARLERRPDGWWVIDAGSTNGTYVNGRRITERRLEAHDVLRVGDSIFRFIAQGVYGFSAYRLDGTVVEQARPFEHGVKDPLLVGGYQIDALIERIAKVAESQISVVITGESGTGKELVAREVHRLSKRRGTFQAINCAALPANLIESELFGYRRGAFSGANADKTGLVKAAHGGTLFLDEIGDMPLEAQAKLLRVLQEREVLPIGSTQAERVDVRVVCATHRDLDAHVASGAFRGDLLARLRELTAALPPLRERREDLYRLVQHFLRQQGRPHLTVSFPFMLACAHYDWPYNVRELESALKVAVTLCSGDELDLVHLPETVRAALEGHGAPASDATAPGTPHQPLTPYTGGHVYPSHPAPGHMVTARPAPLRRGQAPSEEHLRELLARHRGNIAAVGRELGKERMQVHRWLKRYGITPDEYRT